MHRTPIVALALALLVGWACSDSPVAPVPDDPSPSLSFHNPSGKSYIGGLDVWGYCISKGHPTVGYKRGYIAGHQAAYNNWVCQTGPDQFHPTDPHPVNLTAACQWQYDRVAVQAHPDDPDHAWSWKCYASH